MESKFGIQFFHNKCYLHTKPECSKTESNMRQSLPAFAEFIDFQ